MDVTVLRGGVLENRFLIRGHLIAETPVHVGDGGEAPRRIGNKEQGIHWMEADGTKVLVKTVATDDAGKALIPGSSIRGVLRSRAVERLGESGAEALFGTTEGMGRVDVGDARCVSECRTEAKRAWSWWKASRFTYVGKSVALDPVAGTADAHRLFHYELVPIGTQFSLALSGQNVSEEELRDLLSLFTDADGPFITLGGSSGSGLGLLRFDLDGAWTISGAQLRDSLMSDELPIDEAKSVEAGLGLVATFGERLEIVPADRSAEVTGNVDAGEDDRRWRWQLRLETPLHVGSGEYAGWTAAEQKESAKQRNHVTNFDWAAFRADEQNAMFSQAADCAYGLRLVGRRLEPYYNVPASGVRGALRDWTLTHLLPREWWRLEDRVREMAASAAKAASEGERQRLIAGIPEHAQWVASLFGYSCPSSDIELDEAFNRAGRLMIRTRPIEGDEPRPLIEGSWGHHSSDFGPSNAARHLRSRNPIDRVTRASRSGGLHTVIELAPGQMVRVDIVIRDATDDDAALVDAWRADIDAGLIRLGGTQRVGRGRCSVHEMPAMQDSTTGEGS